MRAKHAKTGEVSEHLRDPVGGVVIGESWRHPHVVADFVDKAMGTNKMTQPEHDAKL